MEILLDRSSPVPLHEQIAVALRDRITRGSLRPGDRLLSSRELADRLRVNRTTVVQSYRELQNDGWIECGVGKGTFVCDPESSPSAPIEHPVPAMNAGFDWDSVLPSDLGSGPVSRADSGAPKVALSRAVVEAGLYPAERIQEELRRAMQDFGGSLFEYAPPAGYEPLRQTLRERLAEQGIDPSRNEILIVNGSQQGLDLVGRLLLRDGGAVATSKPTFAGALDVFRWNRSRFLAIPLDDHGMDTEALDSTLARHPARLVYTIPTFHNPTGVVLPQERREQLLASTSQHGVPVLEDDWLAELREPDTPATLKSQDQHGQVMYLGTMSKTLVPGLRVGWLVVPKPAFSALVSLKQSSDLATNLPGQVVLHRILQSGFLESHGPQLRQELTRRRQLTEQCIARHFPREARPFSPHGGMGLWISLPRRVDTGRLLEAALQRGIELSPGSRFDPTAGTVTGFRISYATTGLEQLAPALETLGSLLQEAVSTAPGPSEQPLV